MQKTPVIKVNGPDFIALQVSDIERSRRFWVEVVGLRPLPQSPPGAVVFATEPVPFAITTPKVDLKASTHLGWGVALWMHTENADTLCEALDARGVPILVRPSDGRFGRQFTFADPDGYSVVAHDGVRAAATTIVAQTPIVTLINVFEAKQGQQAALVVLLEQATAEIMRHQPGFISAAIHRSFDGTHVANYGQWRSKQDIEAMLANPQAQAHMREAEALARAEPVLYEVSSVHKA